jgi:pyruvate,water dikinase
VAFTQNPISHDSNQVVINFTEGLGDVVVGGHVLPKSLTIDKSSLLVVSESGHTSRPLESDVRADLVRVCGQIEEIFNAPQVY